MELKLERLYKKEEYTIGKLYIDNVYFSDTIEDKDRGLNQNMTEDQIKKIKVYGLTAIPAGRYKITLTYSPKFKRILPYVNDVKGFSGIRMHAMNTALDSLGCIGVGKNKKKGMILESRKYEQMLVERMKGQNEIFIDIK